MLLALILINLIAIFANEIYQKSTIATARVSAAAERAYALKRIDVLATS